jgi:hypothetical protein
MLMAGTNITAYRHVTGQCHYELYCNYQYVSLVSVLDDRQGFAMFKQWLLCFSAVCVVVSSGSLVAEANPVQVVGAQSQTIPTGTILPLKVDTPLDARTSQVGDPVFSRLATDLMVQASPQKPVRVVLPKGTTIRGRVTGVKKPRWFSRGGWMTLHFDHCVLPDGNLLPLSLTLSASNDNAREELGSEAAQTGQHATIGLYQDPGVGQKLKEDVVYSTEKARQLAKAGIAKGEELGGRTGKVIATPIAAIGGAAVGAGTVLGESTKSLVTPGESVVIEPGTVLLVDFGGSFTIPVE